MTPATSEFHFFLQFQTVFQGIDHHWKENKFATCGEVVEIWDEERSEPIR